MKFGVGSGFLIMMLTGAVSAASSLTVGILQRQIDDAAEHGNFARVQLLRLQLAETFRDSSDYVQAARQYELLLASRPSRSERVSYSIQLGKMREATEDYSGAVSAYQDALHDNPKSWEGNLALARLYEHIDLPLNAAQAYQRCIKMRPGKREPLEELGEVYQQLGYLDRAVDLYKKALAISPQPQTYLKMSDCFMRKGNVAQAKQILEKAGEKVPLADYDIRLGEILLREKDDKGACAAWEKALRSDRQREDVRMHLAMLYNQLHRYDDSDRLFSHLTRNYPQSPLVHFLRAWALIYRGDRKGSRAEAEIVQSLQPTEAVQYYNQQLLAQLR
jgi:tetratricopeptide (TPR) repeat protein